MLFHNDNKAKMCLSCVLCLFSCWVWGWGEGGITTENCQKIYLFLYKSTLLSLEQKGNKFKHRKLILKAAQLDLSDAFFPKMFFYSMYNFVKTSYIIESNMDVNL